MQDLSSAIITAMESNTVAPVVAPTDVVFDMLLAEDNMVNQKLAVKILEKYGHIVEIAENGALAVDAFKQRVAQGRMFDIILVRFSASSLPLSHGSYWLTRWTSPCRSWEVWRPRSLFVRMSVNRTCHGRRSSR